MTHACIVVGREPGGPGARKLFDNRKEIAPPAQTPAATATSPGSRATCEDDEKDKRRRLGTDSIIPHRLTYKKFRR